MPTGANIAQAAFIGQMVIVLNLGLGGIPQELGLVQVPDEFR
ncbi:MAG: hypothetical protein PHS64_04010 [Candidatus Omnitrophica bacterium]|nr:hypothetical protein [Candidatus Omnitrophota bacterium]